MNTLENYSKQKKFLFLREQLIIPLIGKGRALNIKEKGQLKMIRHQKLRVTHKKQRRKTEESSKRRRTDSPMINKFYERIFLQNAYIFADKVMLKINHALYL